MALIHSLEKSGNFLFKYRGQIPVIIFLGALPFVYFMPSGIQKYLSSSDSGVIIGIVSVVALLVSFAGVCIRAYTIGTTPHGTSGRNRDKQVAKQLNTKGIYSMVRHPLYLGNYLMWAGVLLYTFNLSLFLIISLVYWLYYERIMFTEERYLERQFGDEYLNWSLQVPAFIPKFAQYQKGEIPFSFKSVLRREYSGIFALALGFTIVDFLRALNLSNYTATSMEWWRPSLFVLIIFLVLMLVLRTLKHHTHILDREPNRD